jgi:S-adenosylmethionine-diacylgycerolhomoserine-N-methlytransferase
MDRALELRLDRNYRYQRHVYDLTRSYYLLGRNRLVAGLAPPDGGSVLEIGCGTARNLMMAAERYPGCEMFGIDLSRAMLETALRKLDRHGLGDRLMLAHGDATSFDPLLLFGRRSFDRIFFSYALSMMPGWQAALTHAAEHLTPAGQLHIVDFGRGERLPRVANEALRAWLSRFHVTPRDTLERALRLLAHRKRADLSIAQCYRTYAVYAVLGAR